MPNTNNDSKTELLTAAELTEVDLDRYLSQVMAHQVDSGELFFQRIRSESWALENSLVKSASFNVDQGMGVRAIQGEKTGFSHANDLNAPALEQAVNAAKSIARQGQSSSHAMTDVGQVRPLYASIDPIQTASESEKVELLNELDKYTRSIDPRIKEVSISLAAQQDTMFVHASDGVSHGDIRPLIRLNVSVIAEENGRRERGNSGGGGRFGFDWVLTEGRAKALADEAVRMALVNLQAVDAPAGVMPVVLGPGWPGVLLHEAVGHGLEGDFNRKGTSVFSGKIGEKVSSELCTIVDDATIENRRGSLSIDDEGTPGRRTVLIEDGVLVGYMHDKLNAQLMGTKSTGNGRREAYNCVTMPRMTNTFMLNGESEPEEIIRSVDKGVFAKSFSGGQVDITSGKFVFNAIEAYLIEKGQITAPIRGATLIGDGLEVMNHVTMVGNDLELDGGIGVCGKNGQGVPVGVGQPTMKIDELRVGGTSL